MLHCGGKRTAQINCKRLCVPGISMKVCLIKNLSLFPELVVQMNRQCCGWYLVCRRVGFEKCKAHEVKCRIRSFARIVFHCLFAAFDAYSSHVISPFFLYLQGNTTVGMSHGNGGGDHAQQEKRLTKFKHFVDINEFAKEQTSLQKHLGHE